MQKKIIMKVQIKQGCIILSKGVIYDCERVGDKYIVNAGMRKVEVPRTSFDLAK